MSQPPPTDLNEWGKTALVREVQRLRAVLREHADRPGQPHKAKTPGAIIDGRRHADPYGQGNVLLDARSAVLLDEMDVCLVDTKADEPIAMLLSLQGRINYSTERVEHAYLFGADGAAALITELAGLAGRAVHGGFHGQQFAREFEAAVRERTEQMP